MTLIPDPIDLHCGVFDNRAPDRWSGLLNFHLYRLDGKLGQKPVGDGLGRRFQQVFRLAFDYSFDRPVELGIAYRVL